MSQTVTEYLNQGNEQYVNENYEKAIELYSEALKIDNSRDDIYCHRAQAYLQLKKLAEVISDCDEAVTLNESNNKAYVKKGTALFQMEELEKALHTFTTGKEKCGEDEQFRQWISKCEEKIPKKPQSPVSQPTEEKTQTSTASPKVRHDWYQTHTHIVVTVLVKNVKKDELSVDIQTRTLKVTIHKPESEPIVIDLLLSHPIVASESTTKVLSTKVEVKLKKNEGIQWAKLEGEEDSECINPVSAAIGDTEAPRYPTSSKQSHDWDKLAAEVSEEEKNEKLEGDAGLNQFFQKIYADASDETKRAMMKSFTESGGTVLSTNWSEVGGKKVEVKPPDGMEYKQWEI